MYRKPSHRSPARPRRIVALASAATLALTLGLSACSGSSPGPGPESGGQTLRFGLSGEPQEVKVGADSGATGYMLDSLIHRGLLTLGSEGKVAPGLAESWKVVNPATYSFKLRDGLKFSDGSPLTSKNVKNSLLFLADPAHGARTLQAMSGIKTVDTPDDTTVVVHLKENNSSFLGYLADPTAFIAPDSALTAGGNAEKVGAGPFSISSEEEGVSMTIAKNPDYYEAGAVKLDKVDLVYYADGTARTNALISGDVDLMDYVPWEEFSRLKATEGVTVDAQNGLLMDVEFNVTEGPFAKAKVREAVAYALNRDSVVDAAFFGNAQAVYGPPIPKESPYYTDESQKLWSHDPAKAKELLTEAGYPNGFSATLLATSQYVFHQDTALTVQADLKEIGIDVKLDSPDWPTRMEKATKGSYDIKINGWGGVVADPSYVESYLGGPDLAKSYGWKDRAIMAEFAKGRTGATEAARKAAYSEAFQSLRTNVPFVPLVQRGQAFAYSKRVQDFHNLPGFLTFYSGYTLANTSMGS
jgi:ABC-type transport system substrate-binding protein